MLFHRSASAVVTASRDALCFAAILGLVLNSTRLSAQEPQAPVEPGDITLDATAETDTASQAATKYPEIKTAFEMFTSRDFEGAESQLKLACAANPELPPAGVIMGQWYFRAKLPAAARKAFERAVRDRPEDPEAYVVFGDNAIQQRRFTDAILLYQKAAEVAEAYNASPERKNNMIIRAQIGIGAVAEAREMWPEAETALRRVLAINAQNVPAMTRLGRVIYKQGRDKPPEEQKKYDESAYNQFIALYNIDPQKMVRYEINMARLYQQDGQEAKAQKLISRALDRDPETLTTQLAAAQWALETGRLELAETSAKKAIEIDPDSVQVWLLDGLIGRMKGDFAAAESAFRKAHAISPSHAAVLNQLAISLASQDDENKQKQAFEFAQMGTRLFADSKQPIGREAAVTLAWVMHRLGRDNDARRQLQEALTAGPVGADPSYFAAEILHEMGKSDAAIQLLQNAIENGRGIFPSKDKAVALLKKIRGQ